jgi:hypothetical protein
VIQGFLIAVALAVLGLVLAATVSPGAINMAIGFGILAAALALFGILDWVRGD